LADLTSVMTGPPQGSAAGEAVAAKMSPVPFTDLAAMAGEVWPSIEQDYLACLLGGAYIDGPAVTSFEQDWAAYCGAEYAVGVANGTDALELILIQEIIHAQQSQLKSGRAH
jgi:hypothetical protein